jgi:hypothetical protein
LGENIYYPAKSMQTWPKIPMNLFQYTTSLCPIRTPQFRTAVVSPKGVLNLFDPLAGWHPPHSLPSSVPRAGWHLASPFCRTVLPSCSGTFYCYDALDVYALYREATQWRFHLVVDLGTNRRFTNVPI